MIFFESDTISECLQAILERKPIGQISHEVKELLQDVEFLDEFGGVGNVSESSRQELVRLFSVAEGMAALFQWEMEDTPGGHFVGGIVRPERFGISGNSSNGIGVAGRGLNFKSAFESCIGEACEFIAVMHNENDSRICKRNIDDFVMTDLVPIATRAVVTEDVNAEQMELLKVQRLVDGADYFFPAQMLLRSQSDDNDDLLKSSIGLSAGKSIEDATISGIYEVIERDAYALWWYGGRSASDLSKDVVVKMDRFARSIGRTSTRNIRFLDISSDLKIPTVAVISYSKSGSDVVAGLGCRSDLVEATKRAFLEMCQMEVAQEFSIIKSKNKHHSELSAQDQLWIERREKLNVNAFKQFKSNPSVRQGLRDCFSTSQALAEYLLVQGYQTYRVELTNKLTNIPTAKIIIPGLQGTNPSQETQRLRNQIALNKFDFERAKNEVAPI